MREKSIREFWLVEGGIMKEKSKTQDVLNHLKNHGSISQREAVKYYNLYRLSSVIYSLRKRGYEIESEIVPFKSEYGIKSNFAIYHLIGD